MREYPIEDGIHQIVVALGNVSFDEATEEDLTLDPQSVDAKEALIKFSTFHSVIV
jgi:hypothetical protein